MFILSMMITALILAYLCGSLSMAILVCRLCKLPDPRTEGSGNPGTTNVLRLGGKKLAVIVLAGDVLKGLVPVLLAGLILPRAWLGWVGLAAVLGHLFPVFFQFKGGKGVATAAGVLLALAWPLALAVIITWLAMVLLFRYSSLAALTATLLAPVYSFWLASEAFRLPVLIICLLILLRHRSNIQRLWSGQESKIGRS